MYGYVTMVCKEKVNKVKMEVLRGRSFVSTIVKYPVYIYLTPLHKKGATQGQS